MTTIPDSPKKRRGRWWTWLLGALLLLVAAHAVWTFHWRSRFEDRLAALRAVGEPVTLAGLATESIPDAENAAIPFGDAARWYDEHLLADEGLIEDFAMSEDFWRPSGQEPDEEHRETLRALRAWLARGDPYVELLREAAFRPRWHVAYEWEKGPDMVVDAIPRMQQLTVFLSERIRRADAWSPGVRDELVLLAQLSERVELPVVIGMFVEATVRDGTARLLPRAARLPGFDAADAHRALDPLLVPVTTTDRIQQAFREELPMGLWATRRLLDGRELATGAEPMPDSNADSRSWWSWIYTALIYRDGVRFLDLMAQAQDLALDSPASAVARSEDLDRELDPWRGRMVSSLFSHLPGMVMRKRQEHVARMRVARVGLALLVVRQRDGAWPESLDAVRALVPTECLEDPFTGKLLRWQPGVRLSAARPLEDFDEESARRYGDNMLIEWNFDADG
ncbi:MAG: hypothetical protein AAGD14_09915 [Planctomycetota bacterium]